jgi:hypothetical protein
MDQDEIDALAENIFEAYKSRLTQMLLFFFNLATKLDEHVGEKVVLSGFVLVSGNSIKAARYRELTGKPLDRDEIVHHEIFAATPEESVAEYRKWLGDENLPLLATGKGRPVIIFVGCGVSVKFIDIAQLSSEEIQKHLSAAAAEMLKEVDFSDPDFLQEGNSFAQGHTAFLEALRSPRLNND